MRSWTGQHGRDARDEIAQAIESRGFGARARLRRTRGAGRQPASPRRRGGFSLAELIVAGVIASLIAMGVLSSVSSLSRSQRWAQARREAFARADAVASRIAMDVASVVRDSDLTRCHVRVNDGGMEGAASDEVLMRIESIKPMRSSTFSGEGGEYTVQYRVDGGSAWRRVNNALAIVEDGGGVATRLADGIDNLAIEAGTIEEWFTAWDSDSDGLPHGVRVTVTAVASDGVTKAVARRVAAIDRVPIPPKEDTTTNSSGSSTGTSGTGGAM